LDAVLAYDYKTYWYTTKVDHFTYSNNDTYKMRYLVADQYYDKKQKNPPIFFYCGNEGDIEMFTNNTGLMWDWAPEFKAYLIFAEHRFYGQSMPYGDKSYQSPKYLGYLTVDQTLADFADLLVNVKASNPMLASSPIVSFGGSYGGMLAAWFRLKYPHVTKAALASSAPILQFQNVTGCQVYNDCVTKPFQRVSDKCADVVRKSWKSLERKAASQNGLDFLYNKFKLCQTITPANYTVFRDWLYNTYGNIAMMNYPYSTDFLKPVPGYPVREACKFAADPASDSDDDILTAIYEAISIFHNHTGTTKCNDLGMGGGDNLGDAGWDFQSCTEMVMPFCGDGTTDMFYSYSWDFPNVRANCEKKYGVTPDLNKAVMQWGGKDITDLTNVIFSNGEVDPWMGGGVLETLAPSLPAIIIKNAAHHYDLRPANPEDTEDVKHARELEKSYIKSWIGM